MNVRRNYLILAFGVASLALLPGNQAQVRADETVVLDAIDSGHWDQFGAHHADPAYLVGRQGGVRYIGYGVFDLSDLDGRTITAAHFSIWNPASGSSSDIPVLRIRIRIPDSPFTAEQFMETTDGGPLHPERFHAIWNGGAHQDLGYYYFDEGDLDEEVYFRLPYHTSSLQAHMGGLAVLGWDISNLMAGGGDEYAFDGTMATDTLQLLITFR